MKHHVNDVQTHPTHVVAEVVKDSNPFSESFPATAFHFKLDNSLTFFLPFDPPEPLAALAA